MAAFAEVEEGLVTVVEDVGPPQVHLSLITKKSPLPFALNSLIKL